VIRIERVVPPAMLSLIERLQQKWFDHVDKLLTSGYIGAPYGPFQIVARTLTSIWVFIQVGKITIVGKPYLYLDGAVIYAANHSSMFDWLIIYSVIKRLPRFMTAVEEMVGLWGLKAIIMVAGGAFAVDRSKGKTVIGPAIDVIAGGQTMVVFPEGKISEVAVCRLFKPGIGLIAKGAVDVNPQMTVEIVPVHLRFNQRDPATAATSDYLAMGLKWRGGATVTFLDPVTVSAATVETPAQITDLVRQAIVSHAALNGEEAA
jgi:1-acyl-sn-glycerol-3-phosphate acyltransferase